MSTEPREGNLSSMGQPKDDDSPEWIRTQLGAPHPAQGPGQQSSGRDGPESRRPSGALQLLLGALLIGALGFALGQAVNGDASSPTPGERSARASLADQEPVSAVATTLLPSVVQLETGDGIGSGVIYTKRGHILTAAHVVKGAKKVTIRLTNGRRVPGRVVGVDDRTDVGVVRATRGRFQPAELGVGDPVQVGQLAVAIGSPFGLEGSVTSGVVSATDRAVPLKGGPSVGSMIQTDAPINPGNSGGALADRDATVIGINDAIRTTSGVNSGVGFAIPIDIAASVAKALVAGKTPRIGYLGVVGRDPNVGPAGAVVVRVLPKTPAATAGLQRGDLITAVDGRRVESWSELASIIRLTRPGKVVTLDVTRDRHKLQIEVRIGTD